MLITPALIASLAVFVVGAVILWSNPRRIVNQVVFTCSAHIALWLGCQHLVFLFQGSPQILFWVRLGSAIGAFVPLHFWLVKEAIAAGMAGSPRFLRDGGILAGLSLALAVICFTEYFIPSHSTAANRLVGWGYYAYIGVDLGLYAYLLFDAFRTMRLLQGARRSEIQVWLLGGGGIAIAVIALMVLNAVFRDPLYARLQPIVIIVFYTATTLAITTYRVFDARQIILVGVQKTALVGLVALAGFAVFRLLVLFLPPGVAYVGTTAVALWLVGLLNAWFDRLFHFYPQATVARQAAFLAARRESRIEDLEKRFIDVLKGWGQSERAIVMVGGKGSVSGSGLDVAEDSAVVRSIRQLRWATPERLARERTTPDRQELAAFLQTNALGALVIGEGPSLMALIGVGVPISRRPFTYPQITQLLELASIMESALERAHFSVKAQHAEQLATVGLLGASLAHEIRNPLVSIKTFVHLLPKHHHDPVFRHKFFGLIGDEVTRIDRLTEQLLDLASPRVYKAEPMDLHPVLRTSLELVAAKATDKRIEFLTDFQANPDRAFTDGSAAKQVLLNLCFNAIQAVETQSDGPRWVKVATRNVPKGIEMSVEDSGPGISPAIRPRLFQPFQSTKSSGFGLGLAICSDILAGLDATISVDPSVPGRGALFRIVFPCPT